ncbi:hypothetical protein QR680_003540 [Steinernema hermaphroditum]|uniref:Piwi domain-containing protein n=1 Tax=Steinernema hermaphroditum TaxID=289476 RepID=A0AA39HKS2_9BILA|nr:hypothetical protein QR680_003540 [Steinernema hermaphroditum]
MSDCLLPSKAPQGNELREVQSVPCEINGFNLRFDRALMVFQHELTIYGLFMRQGEAKEVDLLRAAKNDAQRQERRTMIWDIFQNLLATHAEVFGGKERRAEYIYDCGFLLYSLKHLAESEAKELFLETKILNAKSQAVLGRNCERIKAKITYTTSFICSANQLYTSGAGDAGSEQRCRALQQFCDILTSQKVNQREDQLVYKNKRYDVDSRRDVSANMAKVIKDGSAKITTIIGNTAQEQGAILLIEPKTSPFFKPGPLKEVFREVFYEVKARTTDDRRFRNELKKLLQGLTVKTTHLARQATFQIKSLTEQTAGQTAFMKEDKTEITVAQYFNEKYRIAVDEHYPCIIVERMFKGEKERNFYPCEVLEIPPGQRVQTQKQTPKLVEQLIEKARKLPSDVKEVVRRELEKFELGDRNEYLNAFGIRIERSLCSATGKMLPPPDIKYKTNRESAVDHAGRRQWKVGNNGFVRPAQAPSRWVVCVFANAIGCDSARAFARAFVGTAKMHGLVMNEPFYDRLQDLSADNIQTRAAYYRSNGVKFVLFLHGGEKRSIERDLMKETETRYKFVTQMVHTKTVLKALSQRGSQMVLDNITMKSNLKLGGVNHELVSSRHHPANFVENTLFPAGRMFIGLDIQSPGSPLMGGVNEFCSDPTVIGMCYTVGTSPADMRGGYWYQEAKEKRMTQLKGAICRALDHYRQKSAADPRRQWSPREIVIFRAGVSEGEVNKIVNEEIPEILDAFKEMPRDGGRPYSPRLTVILAQKQCGIRLMPANTRRGRAIEENVQPGTCVTSKIVNPHWTEFILVAQQALQGTAKPTRYVVLHDDERNRFTVEQLENMTHALCYLHGIVALPVSRPAPLYAATELVKRGRANWKSREHRKNHGDDRSMSSGASDSKEIPPGYFAPINETRLFNLATDIDAKYWA